MSRKYCWLAFMAAVLVCVTGCGEKFKKSYITEARVLQDGWLQPRSFSAPQIYCYHTLAEAACHATPRKGQERRLIGYFGAPPQ